MKKAILIVEDDRTVAGLMASILNEEPGYSALVAYDCLEALQTIDSLVPDLLLLDVMLPGMSGIQLYDLLSENPQTRSIPTIFVTAGANLPEFKARNFTNVIPKPFNVDQFLARVSEA